MSYDIIRQKKAMTLTWRAGKFLSALLVLTCLIGILCAPTVHAAEISEVTITVDQQFITDGLSTPQTDEFAYLLIPETPDTPMPAGSSSESYGFTIANTKRINLESISFDASGIYTYTLRCVTEDMPDYTIDRRIYTIEVYVSDGLDTMSTIYAGSDGKVSELAFEHTHRSPGKPNPPNPPEPPTPPVPPIPKPDTITPGKPGSPISGPKTGDFSNLTLWITLFAIGSVLLIFVIIIGWKLGKQKLYKQQSSRPQ